MPRRSDAGADVVVIGGGLIGLAIAWRAAARGLAVTVCDPQPGRGASYVAAGMLAPVTEVNYGEEALLRLNLAGARRWPDFAAEVEAASGLPAGYVPSGTLLLGYDADDAAALDRLAAYQRGLGLEAKTLTGSECRRLEPLLAPGVRAGVYVADDHSADNRKAIAATWTAAERAGVRINRTAVASVRVERDRAVGILLTDGALIDADTTVVAAGAWSARIAGIPDAARPPVRPVKGELLRLRVPAPLAPFLAHTIRATAKGHGVYLTPRPDGEVVVGATTAELGYDTTVTAGGVYELLRDARTVVPMVSELAVAEALAGLRPGTPDNAPILGPTPVPGLVLATGHYRHGILLAPLTADAIAGLLCDGALPPVAADFTPARFADRAEQQP